MNITDNWYPFEINGETYHLEIRTDHENKSQVRSVFGIGIKNKVA